MIRLLCKVPNDIIVACSGGPDSMAALSFLSARGKRNVRAAYFNHQTEHGHKAEAFIRNYCRENKVQLIVGRLDGTKAQNQSLEEFWSAERNKWFESLELPVISGHHLQDAVEWWLFSAMHGNPKLIPISRNNILRPFLSTDPQSFIEWCERKGVPYILDPGNNDQKFMRSIIRNKILPDVLRVNPGISTVIRKKYANLQQLG